MYLNLIFEHSSSSFAVVDVFSQEKVHGQEFIQTRSIVIFKKKHLNAISNEKNLELS